jgi:hypothetical protein
MLLAGWLGAASAQDVLDQGVPGMDTTTDESAANSGNLSPGVIPRPTPDHPGLVTGVTLGELYTDNLKLAGPGEKKQDSWITMIRPFVRAARSGPRFSGMFDYTLTGYLYPSQSSNNQLAQNLDAQGTLSIVPQHLFLDGTAAYGREIINNALPSGGGTYFLNNNQANVATASLSPWWTQDLGRAGTMTLRYIRGRVVYNSRGIPDQSGDRLSGIPDVTSNGVQFSLISPEYETWGWNLGYTEQRIDPDFGPSADFAVARAGISRQVSPGLRVLADAGKENKYLPDGTVKKLGASFWDAGFEWTTARNHLKVLAGHRFYGHSTEVSWTHTAALLTTTLSYEESPTDLNQQLLGQNPGEIRVTPIGIRRIPSLSERRVYLMKRAMASASYEMPKGRLRLTLYDESRDYFQLDNAREKVANANLSWLYNVGPFTTFTPTFGWQRYKFRDGQVNYTHYAQLALVHQVDPSNFGSVRLRNLSRNVYDGTPGAHGYRVNVIFVDWTHLF